MTCVLDSSVVIAALFEEPGAELAIEALEDGFISTVNLAEVVTVLQKRGGDLEQVDLLLRQVGDRVFPLDRDQALDVGFLAKVTRSAGLSLGDRACLALARLLRLEAVTADRAWLRVADAAGVRVRLIR